MSKKTTEIVTNPHDQFFRESMKDKRVAKEFLKINLPAEICALIDFDELILQPRSQSNAVRRESIVDVLFKTRIVGREAYIYLLLEHQSTPDPFMSLRVIEYTINAIREYLKQHRTKTIPLIYPLVVYHGTPYQFKTDIRDLVDAPRELVDKFFLKPFQLLDLNQVSDETLKQSMWSGIMEFTLKHIFERDMLPFIQEIAPMLQEIVHRGGRDFTGIVLQYVLESAELSSDQEFFNLINTQISDEEGEKIMSLAEKLRLEGEIKGELKGEMKLIKKMLANGVDPVFISKNTGVSIQKIKELQKKDVL